MDGPTFLEGLRDEHETPLSRLGSSKSLYALTGGEMEADAVRAAATADAEAVAATVAAWTDDESNDEAAALFDRVASESRDVAASVDGDAAAAEPSPVYDVLADLDGTPARVGGLAGRGLVTGKVLEQMVGFFVGDADPMAANSFREVRSTVESQRDDAAALLVTVCADETDWTAADDAASAVVEAAYDHYVDTLESMGVKPKNVC
jgi:hypothetical protein